MKELNLLERAIVAPFINEEDKETIAVYPGAFKPPHRGHLSVVEKANAVADKTIVVISQADRDGFTAEDSLKIWEIYTKDMPNVEVRIASKPSPVSEAYSLFRHNPEKNYVMALGKNEFSRVENLDKYHNAKPFDAGTLEDLSSTNLRQAIRENDNDTIQNFLPEGVNLEEYLKVFIKEDQYPENFLQDSITSFAQYMEDSGMQIAPPPRVEFVNDDVENAENLLGKTAYYNPEENVIVLYTLGRHPKDILRSFAHEMIHHIQNLEGRLGGINTTNTNEDDYLDQIEREAYEHGNMTFRNWTDSILHDENINEGKQVGKLYHFTKKSLLEKILSSNEMKGSFMYEDENGKDLYGVSTTRNKNLFYDKNPIRITLDGDKLSNTYKIMPRDYWNRQYNIPGEPQTIDEDEEVILTPKGYVDNIKNYILSIDGDVNEENNNNFKLSELKDIIKSVNEEEDPLDKELKDAFKSGIASLTSNISSAVDKAEKEFEKEKEINEEAITFFAGLILALPTVIQWIGKFGKFLAKKVGNETVEKWMSSVEKFGGAWHHYYLIGVEKALFPVFKFVEAVTYKKISAAQKKKTAKLVFLLIVGIMAWFGGGGAIKAFKDGHQLMGSGELGNTIVKILELGVETRQGMTLALETILESLGLAAPEIADTVAFLNKS